jgi:hypothetical protein
MNRLRQHGDSEHYADGLDTAGRRTTILGWIGGCWEKNAQLFGEIARRIDWTIVHAAKLPIATPAQSGFNVKSQPRIASNCITLVIGMFAVVSASAAERRWITPPQGRLFSYDTASVRRTSLGYSVSVDVFESNGSRMYRLSRQTWELDCLGRRGRGKGDALVYSSTGVGAPVRVPSTELWGVVGRDELGNDWMLKPLLATICLRKGA